MAALGVAVTALALLAVAVRVRWEIPSPGAIAQACRDFVLPDLTVTSVLVLTLGSGALAVLALAARSAYRQVRASRRFVGGLDVVGTLHDDVTVIAGVEPQAFCTGLWHPRVFVSAGAVEALGADELAVVLAHERHHARCHDPLRLLVARVAGDALFFVPGLRRLGDRSAALVEVAADGAAVRAAGGDRRPLASALLAFGTTSDPAVVGIAPERVDVLLGDHPAWELPVALLASGLVVLVALASVAVRLTEASGHTAMAVPTLLTHACMLAMALGPPAAGAACVIGGRRLLRRFT